MRNDIFAALKEVMKSRGLSYKEVSKELDLSESGLKKLMSSKDCSVSRLDKICSVLNLSFEELAVLSGRPKDKITLNKIQEDMFLKNPTYYNFFVELIANDYSWEKIKEKHQLTKEKCISILISLDKVNLIHLGTENKVRKVFDGGDISISSKLGELVTWDIDEAFFHHARNEFNEKKRAASGTRGRYYLRKESLDEMIQSVHQITQEFYKRSKREEVLYGKDTLNEVTMLAFIAQGFRSSDHMKF